MKSPDSRPRRRGPLPASSQGRNPSIVHLFSTPIFYLILVVALGGVALWWFGRGRSPSAPPPPAPHAAHKPSALIAEKKPAKMYRTSDGKLVTEDEFAARRARTIARQRQINQETGWTNGVYYSKDPGFAARLKYQQEIDARNNFLKYDSEGAINILVTLKPGESFDPMTFDRKFEKDFIESLKEEIVIKDDDPDDIRESKLAVIEAKKYLKEQMDQGKDICEIMRETQEHLLMVERTYDDFREQLSDLKRKPGVSEQDIEDFVNAANSILENHGGAKLKMPYKIRKWQLKKQKKKE